MKTYMTFNRCKIAALAAVTQIYAAQVAPAQVPVTPSRDIAAQIVWIQPVVLGESYATDFRSERISVGAGWLVVIQAPTSVLTPRSVAEPLLLASGHAGAGGQSWTESVEWFNHGMASGHRVCFIPSPVNGQGKLSHELMGMRMWFGTPRLPESVDAAILAQERALADAANIQPTPLPEVNAAAQFADRTALIRAARTLIARFAPQDVQPDDVAVPAVPAGPAAK